MAQFSQHIGPLIDREIGPFPNGGYVDDPSDRGGETKWGISKKAHPHLNIASLTRADAADIYAIEYWGPSGCETIASHKVAAIHFDFSVTTHMARVCKALQVLVDVAADGIFGPVTAAAVNESDSDFLAARYTIVRVAYYTSLAAGRKSQKKFLIGWINRAIEVHTKGY